MQIPARQACKTLLIPLSARRQRPTVVSSPFDPQLVMLLVAMPLIKSPLSPYKRRYEAVTFMSRQIIRYAISKEACIQKNKNYRSQCFKSIKCNNIKQCDMYLCSYCAKKNAVSPTYTLVDTLQPQSGTPPRQSLEIFNSSFPQQLPNSSSPTAPIIPQEAITSRLQPPHHPQKYLTRRRSICTSHNGRITGRLAYYGTRNRSRNR